MRMVGERTRPGVQHGQDAGRATHPGRICSQYLHRGRGGLEQESADLLLMQECERTQFLRQREGEQVVVTGKQARA
ncbi:MAG: hypothetical protein L0271_16520 [Gemmatimonadetes bacterium]|nr:hypothetical protein [Gemmatimonadota bacterium]